jgi:hypothetical protein
MKIASGGPSKCFGGRQGKSRGLRLRISDSRLVSADSETGPAQPIDSHNARHQNSDSEKAESSAGLSR